MPDKTLWDYLDEIDFKIVINIDRAIEIGAFELAEVEP